MRLKAIIPLYDIGQRVNVVNIVLERRYMIGTSGGMTRYSNATVTIDRIVAQNVYRILEDGRIFNWSSDLFMESYDHELVEELIEKSVENTHQKIKVGTYLLHKHHNALVFKITSIEIGTIYCNYIDLNIRNQNFNDNYTSYNFDYRMDPNGNFKFINDSMYYPTNAQLEKFSISNDEIIEEKNNILSDLFKYSKYPIKYLKFSARKNSKSEYKTYEEIIFKITNKIYVGYKDYKYVTYKNCIPVKHLSFDDKVRKNMIKQWGKVTIKDHTNSSNLFGHATRKQKMNELVNGKKQIFTISNIILDYEKNEEKYNVIEVFDGTLNLKFLLDDVTLILPNVNNYIIPKDRTIKKATECKIINNKLLPVTKNTKVKVMELFNRHRPINHKVFDKNTIALVMDKGGKIFECKIKQLKCI